jgi:hypothetical protein
MARGRAVSGPVPEVQQLAGLAQWDSRPVNRKDATVSVEGQRFLCDAALRDRKVSVRYDPRDLSSVVIVVDDQRVGRALPQPIGRVAEATPPPKSPAGPKTDYLALLRARA